MNLCCLNVSEYDFLDERFRRVEFGPDFISVIEQNIEKNYSSRRQVCLLNKNERQRRRLLFYGTGNDCFDCLSFSDARQYCLFLNFLQLNYPWYLEHPSDSLRRLQ